MLVDILLFYNYNFRYFVKIRNLPKTEVKYRTLNSVFKIGIIFVDFLNLNFVFCLYVLQIPNPITKVLIWLFWTKYQYQSNSNTYFEYWTHVRYSQSVFGNWCDLVQNPFYPIPDIQNTESRATKIPIPSIPSSSIIISLFYINYVIIPNMNTEYVIRYHIIDFCILVCTKMTFWKTQIPKHPIPNANTELDTRYSHSFLFGILCLRNVNQV